MPTSDESINPYEIDYINGNNLFFEFLITGGANPDVEISVSIDDVNYNIVFTAS